MEVGNGLSIAEVQRAPKVCDTIEVCIDDDAGTRWEK